MTQESKQKIDKLSNERSIIDWIKIYINQNKFISNAIILGFVLWGISLIADTYNPPATQRQIDKIVDANYIRARKDSVGVIVNAVKMEELNSQINLLNLKQEYSIREQAEQKGILLQILSETKSVSRSVKQGYADTDTIKEYLFVKSN